MPHALKEKVGQELDRLERERVIERVQFSDWATPIVPIVKKDGSVRICGNYKTMINQAAKTDTYPLPRIEDIFMSLSGGTAFSKLDSAHVYLQFPLNDGSKDCTTINTHKGLYRYNRLPFGVLSAPAIFQRTVKNLLQGLSHVSAYLDDILVTGRTKEEHLSNLEEVLTRLEQAGLGLRLKRSKCLFLAESVEYLGHRITAHGLQPTDEKIRAIRDAPAPKDISQLKSFLGLVNYYGKFLPHLSDILAPIYKLLQKRTTWTWGEDQQKAFDNAKAQLTSECVLAHYDPDEELLLACDASPYGVGAVLSHRLKNGQERPIAFSSRSLAQAERNYSQLDKEALAIIHGVKKFHSYLYGRHFTILFDHKLLQYLFKETSSTPQMASARLQRWALTLGAYDYEIMYKPGQKNANADGLSRLPLPEEPAQVPVPGEAILLMEALDASPVMAGQMKSWTDRDPVLSKVRDLLLHGWQHSDDATLAPYQHHQAELSVHDGCVLGVTVLLYLLQVIGSCLMSCMRDILESLA